MSGVLKFVKRGGAVAATLTTDDLAASSGGESSPELLTMARAQEAELPMTLDVVYVDPSADYQQVNQRAERMTGNSEGAATIPIPVVLSADKAKQVADALMFLMWVGRTSFRFSVGRKWAKLEPTDVVTIGDYTVRLVKKTEQRQGVIEFEAVMEDTVI